MKKYFVLLLLVLVLLPACALAAAIKDLRISPSDATDMDDVRAISWYTQTDGGNARYIFLPGEVDSKDLKLWFTGPKTITIDGKTYSSGDKLSMTAGKTYTFENGSKKFAVHVMQAGRQGSIYLTTSSGSLKEIDRSRTHKESGTFKAVSAEGQEFTDQKFS